jgi:hypothetical protein
MASEVFEDGIELAIGLLEAVAPSSDTVERSYPLPALRSLDRTEARTFRTIVLENPTLRATILPDLGGRILSLMDKRTETELLPRPRTLVPTPGGRRGLRLPVGIELRLDAEDRPNAMGRVAVAPDLPAEEEDPAGVWIAETGQHQGLAFHLHLSLPPDRSALRVEVRVQNRTFAPLPYRGELVLHGAARALAVAPEGDTFLSVRREGDTLLASRFDGEAWLAPRQVDTWTVHLIPLEGGALAATPEVALFLDDEHLRAQAVVPMESHKFVLRTADGRSLEAPANLDPAAPLEIQLDGLPAQPVAVALLDPYGREILRGEREAPVPPYSGFSRPPAVDPLAPLTELRRLTFDPARRGPAYAALGAQSLAKRDFDAADVALEQSLLYNGDDPLAWWALSATRRLRGDEGERPELLNAHFLAPLEPLLRAESFLGQSPAMGKEPSPLIAPVAEIPEDLVEVACVLIEHGLLDQANRWIDEALRHHDLAMLRYLMADVLLRGTRMEAEAAEHMRAAAGALVPPLPWRPVEIQALRNVHARFPNDAAAKRLLDLAERHTL